MDFTILLSMMIGALLCSLGVRQFRHPERVATDPWLYPPRTVVRLTGIIVFVAGAALICFSFLLILPE